MPTRNDAISAKMAERRRRRKSSLTESDHSEDETASPSSGVLKTTRKPSECVGSFDAVLLIGLTENN